MHNKYFAFFGSKNSKEGKTGDKTLKCLYKNDNKDKDKTHKKKSKNRNTRDEDKQQKERKRKHRNKESINSQPAEAEVPPQNTKRHRKKSHKSEEIESKEVTKKRKEDINHEHIDCECCEAERKVAKKKYRDLAKFIKEHKEVREDIKNSKLDDDHWVMKKEILKLINKSKSFPKDDAISSNLVKKFFVFDKKDVIAKYLNDCREENTNTISKPVENNTKKKEKTKKHKESKEIDRRSEKESKPREQPVDLVSSRKVNDQNVQKNTETPPKKKHKKKPLVQVGVDLKTKDDQNVPEAINPPPIPKKAHKKKSSNESVENLKNMQKEIMKLISVVQKTREKGTEKNEDKAQSHTWSKPKTEIKSKSFPNRDYKPIPEPSNDKDEENISNVNPIRHRLCLVKNTFSIVEIPPVFGTPSSPIEKKKKSKAFKKYYRYNKMENEVEVKTETYQTYSDSNKLYQELPEQPNVNKKAQRVNRDKEVAGDLEQKLKTETHVSAVVIASEVEHDTKRDEKKSVDSNKIKNNVLTVRNSKIPVLSSPGKVVEKIKKNFVNSRNKKKVIEETSSNQDDNIKTFKENTLNKQSQIEEKDELPKFPKEKDSTKEKLPNRTNANSSNGKTSSKVQRISLVDQAKNGNTEKPLLSKRFSEYPKVNKKESKMTNLSNISKFSRQSKTASRNNGGKKLNKTSLESESEPKLHQTKTAIADKPYKTFQRSPTKSSFSNSTFGDKSTDSSTKTTSLFLTKTFRDDDKLTRWQKSKQYADTVRKNLINKNKKIPVVPPVMEVRYLTVTNEDMTPKESVENTKTLQLIPKTAVSQEDKMEKNDLPIVVKAETEAVELEVEEIERIESEPFMEFLINDLPQPCMEFSDYEKFNKLFLLPTDEALNEIMHENYNFLKKDFSYNIDINDDNSSTSSDLSSDDLALCEKKFDDWHELDEGSLSDSSCNSKLSDIVNLESRDGAIDSCSAPGSEESGYSTVESSRMSSNFFDRPEIKALLYPSHSQTPQDSYFLGVQMETKSPSNLEIRSIESKSLQTVIEYSQKSVQIKLSQEEILEYSEAFSSGEEENGKVTKTLNNTEDKKDTIVNSELKRSQTMSQKQVCSVTKVTKTFFCGIRSKKRKGKRPKKSKLFSSCITCVSDE